MTELEIEKEIQARVEFKMREFLTAVKNRLGYKYNQAFDMTLKSQEAWKAFEEISEMLNKEIFLPTPYDNMANERKRRAKNIAVNKIVERFDLIGMYDYRPKINCIVSAIEEAQDW